MRVEFLQGALGDLEEIIKYISSDSISAAWKMRDKIVSKSKDLETIPTARNVCA